MQMQSYSTIEPPREIHSLNLVAQRRLTDWVGHGIGRGRWRSGCRNWSGCRNRLRARPSLIRVRIRRLLGLLRARRLCVLGLWGLPWTPTRHYASRFALASCRPTVSTA